jgi:hypothetical protein
LLNRGYEMVVSLNGAMVFDSIAWFVTGVRASTGTQCVPLISRNISGGSKQFSN